MAENNNIQNGEGEGVRRVCGLPPQFKWAPDVSGVSVSADRKAFVLDKGFKWAIGSNIKYYFENDSFFDSNDKQVVRDSFKEWQSLGISISFTEVKSRVGSDIRIEFGDDNSAWSLVGKNSRDYPNEATMHFGWSLSEDRYGKTTAIHEIGHALGLHHEHQNPNLKINWDEKRVLQYFKETNGWDSATTRHNILDTIPPSTVFTSVWDSKSVMEYSFPPGLIKSPKPYDTKGIPVNYDISETDKAFVLQYYPPNNHAIPLGNSPLLLKLNKGEEGTYSFTPSADAEYKINITGDYDALIVVFNSNGQQVGAADDSLTDGHAFVKLPLNADEEYIIRVRLYGSDVEDDASAVLFAKKLAQA